MRNTLLLIFVFIPLFAFGQSYKLFTSDKELSSSLVNRLYQDRNDMIWILTENGLNRFDGVKFTAYKNVPGDASSLNHNYVSTIFEDKDGHLFVGGHNGIQVYDTGTDAFSPLAVLPSGYTVSQSPTSVIQRKSGEVWVSGNFLCRLLMNGATPTLEEIKLPLSDPRMNHIMEDSAGNLWICNEEEGIYKLNPDNRLTHYFGAKETPSILFLYEDPFSGTIYGGSPRNGLFRYDPRTDSFVAIPYEGRETLSIKSILSVAPHQLYIGTDGNGMKVYDDRTGRITDFRWENNLIDLKDAKVHDIKRDREGNLWLAIFQRGVLVLPMQENGFGYIGYKSGTGNVIGSKSVTSFWKGDDGVLYVGTDNDGLYALNPDGSLKAHYRHTDDPHSVPPIVINLFEDSRGRLWIGSYGNGVAIMDRQSGRCDYQPLNGQGGKPVRNVYAFTEDTKRGRLWIGTMGNGLFYYDMKRGVTAVDSVVKERALTSWIDCLHYSPRHDRLYIGSYSGLHFIDLSKPEEERQGELTEQIIYSLYEDEEGNLWVGSSGGLTCWNQQNDEHVTYTAADGLCSSSVYAIQGDEAGRLWVSTSNGLSHFFVKERRFVNYYAGDGVQGNEFSKNASFCDQEGILWFGGINGITYLDPHKIAFPHKKYTPRITDFYLYGSPVRTSTLSGGSHVIDCPVFDATEFRLAWPDNSFSIELSTQELSSPERITYLYAMGNDHWITLPQGTNRVSFTKLPPGTYRFLFKAKNHDIESDVRQVTIRIAPPWWRSAWAYAVYVLLALAAAYLIFRAIRQHYHDKQEALQRNHERQLNEARMQLFINIAHEIRTPMILIINPLKKLMKTDTDENHQKEYNTIQRNSDRILHLLDDMLDVRKIDKGQMHLTFRETEMVKFIQGECDFFSDLSEQRQTALTFRHDGIESLSLWIDPGHFDKVLLNILSNAFKFTPQGGRIEVCLRLSQPAGTWREPYAEISVTDSGIGIPKEDLEHVFDRFYQVRNNSNHSQVGGSGIGLHLTRSLVELHHGHVRAERVTDEQGGTRFIVELPTGNAHLSAEETDTVGTHSDASYANSLKERSYLPDHRTHQGASLQATSPRPHTRYRIMLVEDDEEILNYLQGELSRDYHLILCADGREALESIHQKAPDLVVSDIMMPRMDGLTLCRKLKQNIRLNHIPVILLTAKTRLQDNLEGLETGADAYIMKPFDIDILRQTIENLINSRQQLRNIYTGDQQASEEKLETLQADSPDEKLMERVMRCVNCHLSDPELTVETIASEVGLSRGHLYRKLKELTNQNPSDFVRNLRLRQAAKLLEEKRHAISEVATLVGFTTLSTFSTAFKALYGLSPTEYRGKLKTDESPEEATPVGTNQ